MDSVAVRGAEGCLNKDQFVYFLDHEVKRAHRYQNFFCLLVLRVQLLSDDFKEGLKDYHQRTRDLIVGEVRGSDLIGFLDENRIGIFLPYASSVEGDQAKLRLEHTLKYQDSGNKAYEVMIQNICFPTDGAYTAAILEKAGL